MAEYNSADEQWLILNYRPTSLFSLRMTHATSKVVGRFWHRHPMR